MQGYFAQACFFFRIAARMVGQIASHPDHKMLVLALIKKQHIAGLSLIDVAGDEAAVLLNNGYCRGIG